MIDLLSRLKRYGPALRRRRGGINFIELMVAIVVIAIASCAFAQGFFTAFHELEKQRHRMEAVQLLKAEAQFWVGRIHTAFPSAYEMDQWHEHPNNPVILGAEGVVTRPRARRFSGAGFIDADIKRSPIRVVNLFDTAIEEDFYEFTVTIDYEETHGTSPEYVHMELDVPIIRSVVG